MGDAVTGLSIAIVIGLLSIALTIHVGLQELRKEVAAARFVLAKVIQDFEILKAIFQRIETETSLRLKAEEANLARAKKAEQAALNAKIKEMIANGARVIDD